MFFPEATKLITILQVNSSHLCGRMFSAENQAVSADINNEDIVSGIRYEYQAIILVLQKYN